MKILVFLVIFVLICGCINDDSSLRNRVRILEEEVHHLQKDQDDLAKASIQNSKAIESNSDSIITLAKAFK